MGAIYRKRVEDILLGARVYILYINEMFKDIKVI